VLGAVVFGVHSCGRYAYPDDDGVAGSSLSPRPQAIRECLACSEPTAVLRSAAAAHCLVTSWMALSSFSCQAGVMIAIRSELNQIYNTKLQAFFLHVVSLHPPSYATLVDIFAQFTTLHC
jgi:hypothetical protein